MLKFGLSGSGRQVELGVESIEHEVVMMNSMPSGWRWTPVADLVPGVFSLACVMKILQFSAAANVAGQGGDIRR